MSLVVPDILALVFFLTCNAGLDNNSHTVLASTLHDTNHRQVLAVGNNYSINKSTIKEVKTECIKKANSFS